MSQLTPKRRKSDQEQFTERREIFLSLEKLRGRFRMLSMVLFAVISLNLAQVAQSGCAGTYANAWQIISTWSRLLTLDFSQQMEPKLKNTSDVLSKRSDGIMQDTSKQEKYLTTSKNSAHSGFWNSNREELLTSTYSLHGRQTNSGLPIDGSTSSIQKMNDTCMQEPGLNSSLKDELELFLMQVNTLQRWNKRPCLKVSKMSGASGESRDGGAPWQLPLSWTTGQPRP